MSEIIPPSEPSQQPPAPPPPQPDYQGKPPGKLLCAAIGFGILIVTSAGSYVLPPFFLLGLVAAIASLFFAGYRFIFLGYIIPVGVALLAAICYCSVYPPDFK